MKRFITLLFLLPVLASGQVIVNRTVVPRTVIAASTDPRTFPNLIAWYDPSNALKSVGPDVSCDTDGDVVRRILDYSSIQNNIGQPTGASQPLYKTTSRIGKTTSFLFDGVNDELHSAADIVGTGDATYFAWIKPTEFSQTNNGRIFDNSKTKIYLNGGKLSVTCDGSTTVNSAAGSVATNSYSHICVTITTAGVINIYINNALSGPADQASAAIVTGGVMSFGNNGSLTVVPFGGNIESMGIYLRILPPGERTYLYAY